MEHIPEWLQDIGNQLDSLYHKCEAPYETLFNAYNESLQREEAAMDEQQVLHEQLVRLEANYANAKKELEEVRTSSGHATDSRKFQELDHKYRMAKDERIQLLRNQFANSQKLLELNETIKKYEILKERFEQEIKALQGQIAQTDQRLSDYAALVEEKNLNIEILQDELQAIQLELLQTDERVKKLEGENEYLVQRWLNKVNETAEVLNEQVSRSSQLLDNRKSESYKVISEIKNDLLGQDRLISHRSTSKLSCISSGKCLFYNYDEVNFEVLKGVSVGSYSRDGDLFIAVLRDRPDTAEIYSTETCALVDNISGSAGSHFLQLTITPSNNNAIMAVQSPQTLRLYDLTRSFCLWSESFDSIITAVSPIQSPQVNDGAVILTEDGKLCLWDIRRRKVIEKSPLHLPKFHSISTFEGGLIGASEHAVNRIDVRNFRIVESLSFGESLLQSDLQMAADKVSFSLKSKNSIHVCQFDRPPVEIKLASATVSAPQWITTSMDESLLSILGPDSISFVKTLF